MEHRFRSCLWVWGPSCFYAVLLLVEALSKPRLHAVVGPLSFSELDKLAHACAYALFFVLFRRSFSLAGWSRPSLRAFTSAALFGAIHEILQALVPHRSCEFFDWVANVVGAGIAWFTVGNFCGEEGSG